MNDGRQWYKADQALADAERILSGGAGVLVERVRNAAVSLSCLQERDVPGWIWDLVEQAIDLAEPDSMDEASAESFVELLRDLRVKLDGELEDGSSLWIARQSHDRT